MSGPETSPAPWVRLSFQVRSQVEDQVLAWLQDESALGSETSPESSGMTEFRIYFPAGSDEQVRAALTRLEAALGRVVSASLEPVPDERWVEEYQRGLEPFDVGRRFRVFPGDTAPPGVAARKPLWITPGRAFGTGEHATTSMCLEYLESAVQAGGHVLDVGTGSGILAIAAIRLGAARVVAVEVDPEAARIARENLLRNHVMDRVELVVGTTAAVSGSWFDLLTANLRSGILCESMQHLAYRLRPGGRGVLSGILSAEAASVERAATQCGLESGVCQQQGEWVAVAVEKPA